MLQSRHGRTRSQQPSAPPSIAASTQANAFSDPGIVEWSKTTTRACSRLLASLQPIFNRGESFTGVAGDSYGLLLSNDSAFIFPYTNTSSMPPILTFPLPQGEETLLGALIPGPSHEPGLLVVMPTSGRIGYWPALHSALAPSSGIESRLSLGTSESVSRLCNAGAAGLVLATSTGRMMHVSLRDAAGKAIVLVTNMSSASGWLGALKSVATRKEIVAVKAGAAQSREERQVHSITRRGGLTIWEVARGGNYRTLLDCDLWPLLLQEDVAEVVDVAAYPAEANAILLLARTASQAMRMLIVHFSGEMQPSVARRFELPRMEEVHLHLPNPGHVAFIQTRKTVHMVHLQEGQIESIDLQSDVEIVATGLEDQLKNKRNPGLILLTNGAGVIRIEIFTGAVTRQDPVKSRLEQAVFFGRLDNNPVSFHPPPKDSDIMAREVSHEVLQGTSPFSHRSVHVRDTLQARMQALQCLVTYIGKHVKSTTLQVLREDAEKMAAGEALWNSIDARVEGSGLISRLVPKLSQTSDKAAGGDAVRHFFLHGLGKVADIVINAHRACVEAAAVMEDQTFSAVVLETNEILLAILMTATRHRDDHAEYEGAGEKWTSRVPILQATTVQLSLCRKLLAGLKQGGEPELKDQVVGLTALSCRLYDDYLQSTPETSSERQKMQQKYHQSRPDWLRDLVTLGRVDKALEIGERFRDFQSLIEICHDQGEAAKDEDVINTVVRRLEWYLHTFQYDFASVLWEYYISHRQFWNLLHEFPNYRQYLTTFFLDGRYPSISWMNDVILGDFHKAGMTLLNVSETRIEKKKIQLSIAKLALLVNNDTVPASVEQQLQTSLIMDTMMKELKELANEAIDSTAAIEICSDQLSGDASRSPDRKMLLQRHITKLIHGESLSTGEAVDYLTTKTNPNFFDALRLVAFASLPSAVQTFLEQLIWRRCFISDDWVKIVDTTGQSDAIVADITARTNLYQTIEKCFTFHTSPEVNRRSPKGCYFVEQQVTPFQDLSAAELSNLKKEYASENELLDRYEALADLPTWYAGIQQTAKDAALSAGNEEESTPTEHENDDVFMEE